MVSETTGHALPASGVFIVAFTDVAADCDGGAECDGNTLQEAG